MLWTEHVINKDDLRKMETKITYTEKQENT